MFVAEDDQGRDDGNLSETFTPTQRDNIPAAARDVISAANLVHDLARRVGRVQPGDGIPPAIQRQKWSPLNVPLIWAAASSNDGCSVLRRRQTKIGSVAGTLHFEDVEYAGGQAVLLGWTALRDAMRSWGVRTPEDLAARLRDAGFHSVRAGQHFSGRAQEHVLQQATDHYVQVCFRLGRALLGGGLQVERHVSGHT